MLNCLETDLHFLTLYDHLDETELELNKMSEMGFQQEKLGSTKVEEVQDMFIQGKTTGTPSHITAVAVQTSLFEHRRTFVQCCTVFMYSTFVSYCTLHSTNCTQFKKWSRDFCGCANQFI